MYTNTEVSIKPLQAGAEILRLSEQLPNLQTRDPHHPRKPGLCCTMMEEEGEDIQVHLISLQ